MNTKAAPVPPRSTRRLVSWGIATAMLTLAGLGGVWLWFWWHDRTEHEAALAIANQDSFRENEPLLRRVHQRHPDDVVVVRTLALGCLADRRLDDAELFLNRWCEMRPREAEPLLRRIDLWKLWQRPADAVADAQRVLELQPSDSRGRLFLAQMLVWDARFKDAESQTLHCLQAQPQNVEIWYLLATIYQRQGRTAEAADLVDRLLLSMPDSVPTLVLRADLHLDAGQVEPAIQLLTRAAGSPVLNRPVDSYQLSGQAYPSPLAVAEKNLDRTFVLYQLSQALVRAGREKEAKAALAEVQWRRALVLWSEDKHRDTNIALQARVVDTYMAADKLPDAVGFLNEILARQPDSAGTHQLLAECYDKTGQTDLAVQQRRLSGQGK